MSGTAADAWTTGDAYDAYMGRWSRALARVFLDWLRPTPDGHWLEVGCGTGALSRAILEQARPASLLACDPARALLEHAARRCHDERATFVPVGADALPQRAGGFDQVVSALVLNFVAEPERAVEAMRERVRNAGSVAACVWDYAGGVEFLHYFWRTAVELDPAASDCDESRRFAEWGQPSLEALFRDVGLREVNTSALSIPTAFADFEDYWQPFLGATGPAPSYVASLDGTRREQLRQALRQRLPLSSAGGICLHARAWAVRGARA